MGSEMCIRDREKAARDLKAKEDSKREAREARTPKQKKEYSALVQTLVDAAQKGNGKLSETYEALTQDQKLSLQQEDKDAIKEISNSVN